MKSSPLLLTIIVLIACLAGVSSDIYAPSIPAITVDLKTTIDDTQYSMAIFMLGISLSQLIYGPLSDAIGRKGPLITGLLITVVGSFICLTATSISILIAGRFIQGIGAGAGASLWRSIFRDCFSGNLLAKYGAYLSIIIIFVVPAAPTLGAYLQTYFGWRSSFVFLIAYSLITLAIVVCLFKETSIHHHKDRMSLEFFKKSFGQLLKSRIFMGYSLCTFLSYGAFFSWFVVGPVLLIKIVGITPIEFGWITLFGGGISMASASLLNTRIITKVGNAFMLRLGWSLMIIAGMLMLLLRIIYGINTLVIVGPMILFYFGATLIWPSVFAGAFTPFGKIAGYAGALYSFMQIGGAAVLGTLVAYLPDSDQIPLALIFITAPALAWLIFEGVVRPHEILSDSKA